MNKLIFEYHLTAASIISYSQSIEAPLQKVGGVLIAPSTMPVLFWKIEEVPWLDKEKTYLHGRQTFTYKAPLQADTLLDCELTLSNKEEKTGRSGHLILYTHTLTCSCKDERIVKTETVLISSRGDSL